MLARDMKHLDRSSISAIHRCPGSWPSLATAHVASAKCAGDEKSGRAESSICTSSATPSLPMG